MPTLSINGHSLQTNKPHDYPRWYWDKLIARLRGKGKRVVYESGEPSQWSMTNKQLAHAMRNERTDV